MKTTIHPFARLSCLALLCAFAILLAWAVPAVIGVTDDSLDLLQLNQDHPSNDLAAEQSETTDVTDDPVLPSSSGRPDLQPLTFSLHAAHLSKRVWSSPPPVRPPVMHV